MTLSGSHPLPTTLNVTVRPFSASNEMVSSDLGTSANGSSPPLRSRSVSVCPTASFSSASTQAQDQRTTIRRAIFTSCFMPRLSVWMGPARPPASGAYIRNAHESLEMGPVTIAPMVAPRPEVTHVKSRPHVRQPANPLVHYGTSSTSSICDRYGTSYAWPGGCACGQPSTRGWA